MRRAPFLPLLIALAACVVTPPAPPAPRMATPIHASFGRTWDAVIDEFAAQNIPIRTMERASGFIATDALAAGSDFTADADCGKDFTGTKLIPSTATYNVLVRGDSAASTVKITVKWQYTGEAPSLTQTGRVTFDCSTTGTWETLAEARIKSAAEHPTAAAQ